MPLPPAAQAQWLIWQLWHWQDQPKQCGRAGPSPQPHASEMPCWRARRRANGVARDLPPGQQTKAQLRRWQERVQQLEQTRAAAGAAAPLNGLGLFTGSVDHRHNSADGNDGLHRRVADPDDAFARAFDFHRGLVGLDVEQRLRPSSPCRRPSHARRQSCPCSHVHVDLGENDFNRHGSDPALHEIAQHRQRCRAVCGTAAFSRMGL
jgi:hypothetical protein